MDCKTKTVRLDNKYQYILFKRDTLQIYESRKVKRKCVEKDMEKRKHISLLDYFTRAVNTNPTAATISCDQLMALICTQGNHAWAI